MSTELVTAFVENVLRLMDEYQWTQKDLSEQMEVTQSFVSQVLTGKRTPGLEVVEKFAVALDVSAVSLFVLQEQKIS